MQATMHASRATDAWRHARRRRTTGAIVGTASDAAAAAGGLVIANAALSLGIGLPTGATGLTLGVSILLAGLAGVKGRTKRDARTAELTLITTRTSNEERRAA